MSRSPLPLFESLTWASTGARPRRGLVHVDREMLVAASPESTFAFFSDASNLERLTPPWLNFRIRTRQPIDMREGSLIDYEIRLYGVPIPWTSRIDVWEEGVRFVDRQVRGPYRWWRHEHGFEAAPGGTRVLDRVEFVPRLRWITSGLVRRDVERIFAYRQEALRRIFSGPA